MESEFKGEIAMDASSHLSRGAGIQNPTFVYSRVLRGFERAPKATTTVVSALSLVVRESHAGLEGMGGLEYHATSLA